MTWESIFEAISHQSRSTLSKNTKTLFSFDEYQTLEERFFIEIPQELIPLKEQRKWLKIAHEKYREHHIHVLKIYSKWFININGVELPLFSTDAVPQYFSKEKKVRWFFDPQSFILNEYVPNREAIPFEIIEKGGEMQDLVPLINTKVNLTDHNWHLVIDVNSQLGILNDVDSISAAMDKSQAMAEIQNEELVEKIPRSPNEYYADFNTVAPADYSQYRAIEWYRMQKSFVLCGPPGTGKTQTILNMAFQAARDGKSILIVSQKYSALEVLHHKIDEIGLGEMVLFLNALSEKSLLQKIERRYQKYLHDTGELQPSEQDLHLLKTYRHQHLILMDYYTALFSKKGQGLSYFEIEKRLKSIPKDSISQEDARSVTMFDLIEPKLELQKISVVDIQRHLEQLIEAMNHMVDKGWIDAPSIDSWSRTYSKLQLLSQLPIQMLTLWFGAKNKPKRLYDKYTQKIQALKTKKQKELNRKNNLILSMDKTTLDYLKKQLLEDKILTRWFSNTYKSAHQKVTAQIPDWDQLDLEKKMQRIEKSIEWHQIEEDIQSLEFQLSELMTEYQLGDSIQLLLFIENKKSIEEDSWSKLIDHYLSSQKKIRESFAQVSTLLDWFRTHSISIKEPLPKSIQSLSLTQKEWQDRCESPLMLSYKELLAQRELRIKEYPVLKNYTYREIIGLVSKNKKLLPSILDIHKDHLEQQLGANFSNLYQSIISKYNKQSIWTKEEKDQLKNELKWIEKKWSKKKFRHSSRYIFQQIGSEIRSKLFPIVIATPEKVSMQLPLVKESFDYVIFDECSQMELMYSIPSLYRAKKVILVGDDQQLAPTNFFKREGASILSESLYSFGEAQLDRTMLSYHYRSVYNNLIQFSNTFFYNSELKTTRKSSDRAIEYHYCPNGVYELRENEVEAKVVVDKLKTLSNTNTKDTIGIACFSVQQKLCIEKAIEREKERDASFWEFMERKEQENLFLFVKNIETLQGDERDIMIISVGYGKNRSAQLYQFFGPILRFGGERRLNVLLSRARKKMILITSLKSTEIRVSSDNLGLRVFKSMLQWVENPQSLMVDQKAKSSHEHYLDYFFRLN